jgi:hypothetical protein
MIKNLYSSRLALFCLLLMFRNSAIADALPSNGEGNIRWSVDHRVFALSRSGDAPSTTCYDAKSGKVQWTIPEFFSDCYLSAGGGYIVGISQGGNLLTVDDFEGKTVISFWKKELKLAAYTIRDLKGMGLRLQRTQSHWAWADDYGMIGPGFYIIDPSGGVFVFSPHTGKLYMRGNLNRLEANPEVNPTSQP